MDFHNLYIEPIHKHPELMHQCCKLINDEWPRSETARMISLKASSDNLPTSLIIMTSQEKVIGHCKLTRIPSLPESCFIESVVISKALRGQKLGSFLMKKAEEYCKNTLNLKTMHLSTRGQEGFYAKLGYETCAPISTYGNFMPSNSSFNCSLNGINAKVQNKLPTDVPPPPPPPPKPYVSGNRTNPKTYMCKNL